MLNNVFKDDALNQDLSEKYNSKLCIALSLYFFCNNYMY